MRDLNFPSYNLWLFPLVCCCRGKLGSTIFLKASCIAVDSCNNYLSLRLSAGISKPSLSALSHRLDTLCFLCIYKNKIFFLCLQQVIILSLPTRPASVTVCRCALTEMTGDVLDVLLICCAPLSFRLSAIWLSAVSTEKR